MGMSGFSEKYLKGIEAAWPICLGYVPIGLAFGVLAQKAGLGAAEILMMSVLVFAGSSQFIAVSMLAADAAAASIILTTLTVNLRHVLMSSSLAVYLQNSGRKKLSLFAYGVTDESFAVNYSRLKQGNWNLDRCLAVNHTANLAWILSTVTGGYGGQYIPAGAFGIDYALIAMFICLLVFQLKGRRYVTVCVLSGGLAVVLSLIMPGNLYVVISSALAAALGVLLRSVFATAPTPRTKP